MELLVFEISEQSAHNAVQTSIEEKCNYTRVYELELGQRENSSGKKKKCKPNYYKKDHNSFVSKGNNNKIL